MGERLVAQVRAGRGRQGRRHETDYPAQRQVVCRAHSETVGSKLSLTFLPIRATVLAMALKTIYDNTPTEELARDPREPIYPDEPKKQPTPNTRHGLLAPILEMGPKGAALLLVGAVAVGGVFKITEARMSAIFETHQVPKTHVEPNAQNPYAAYSHITTRIKYKQQEIGK